MRREANVCKKKSAFHLSNALLLPTEQKGKSARSGSLPGNRVERPHSTGVETEAQRDEEMCLRSQLVLPELGKSRVNVLLPTQGSFPHAPLALPSEAGTAGKGREGQEEA